jgi:cellulose synthase/poly-beta-1,6-N-acetylglucosamine synthase-like glycosyltransferase
VQPFNSSRTARGNGPPQRPSPSVQRRAVTWTLTLAIPILVWVYLSPLDLFFLCIMALVAGLVFVSATSLSFKLHAWQTPGNLESLGFDPPQAPQLSFSLIYPVRSEPFNVILATIQSLATQDHPDFEIVIAVSGDDDEITRESCQRVAEMYPMIIRIAYVYGEKRNKPLALQAALAKCTKEIIAPFDAESLAAPHILLNVDTKFSTTGADVVQAGVQLMNYRDSWYSLQNCLEYYWWFKSRLHFQAKQGFITLGGNTVFIRRSSLDAVGGWDVENLTEDADLGVRLSVAGARIEVVYDPVLATREETPATIRGLRNQRRRWMQGFFQTYRKDDWRQLPGMRRRLLARYTLMMPFAQAASGFLVPISAITVIWIKLPTLIALATFLPLIPSLTTLAVDAVALREFGADYGLKIRWRDYVKLILGSFPYQFVLSAAAIMALVSVIIGSNDWIKTDHSGSHHDASDILPAGETA